MGLHQVAIVNEDGTPVDMAGISTSERIMSANDAHPAYTWLDFGLSTQRISTIVWTSATVLPGHSATRTFNWTNVGGVYRLDSAPWSYT